MGVKVYRKLSQQDELSVREPTEDKLPTTFSSAKRGHKIPSTLLGLHKKENRFLQAPFGACFVEKLTTEDWPGPVLASLNIRRPKDTVNQEVPRRPRNLSVGQNRAGPKMIIAGAV